MIAGKQGRLGLACVLLLVVQLLACGGGGPAGGGAAGGRGGTSSGGDGGTAAGGRGGTSSGGNGGTAAGGKGGAASGGNVGAAGAGTAGSAGVAISPGTLAVCPASIPAGPCAAEGIVCTYPTGSCVCEKTGWRCVGCPASRPEPNDSRGFDSKLWANCRYGDVTCTTRLSTNPTWGCGVCPASRPSAGDPCGNARFECSYGNEICYCNTNWACVTPTCSTHQDALSACLGQPVQFSCQYPELGQNCTCGGLAMMRLCSCPASMPAEGSPCLSQASGCRYGDTTCTCAAGQQWHCPVPETRCPTSAPANASACTTPLSCSYGAAFCYCNGTSWGCS